MISSTTVDDLRVTVQEDGTRNVRVVSKPSADEIIEAEHSIKWGTEKVPVTYVIEKKPEAEPMDTSAEANIVETEPEAEPMDTSEETENIEKKPEKMDTSAYPESVPSEEDDDKSIPEEEKDKVTAKMINSVHTVPNFESHSSLSREQASDDDDSDLGCI